jgi:thioredoxin 1
MVLYVASWARPTQSRRYLMAEAITTATFDSIISSADKPVLVDFWASWCGPCRALGPVVEEIGEEMADKLDVYKCDVDAEGDIAQRFRIVSIPTLILFKGGEAAHTMVGNLPKAQLVAELTANL